MADDFQTPPGVEEITKPPTESNPFIPPTIHRETLLAGASYTRFSPVPPYLQPPSVEELAKLSPEEAEKKTGIPCCLGIDEAGRGPVLGPMVYGTYYLPIDLHRTLLADEHGFDDSKVLKPEFRAMLMERICTPPGPPSDDEKTTRAGSTIDDDKPDPKCLFSNGGYGVSLLSAPSISAAMLQPMQYNLNAQAVDATIHLINTVILQGVNVREIYIDTIGQPGPYQKKLERIFPGRKVTVEKKADSLYPVVSAASVVAKVTRDVALEVMYEGLYGTPPLTNSAEEEDIAEVSKGDSSNATNSKKRKADSEPDWGSGYPSDIRCTSWLKRNMDPVFGWGPECRFSWGTAKDLLEKRDMAVDVQWPVLGDEEGMRVTDYFGALGVPGEKEDNKAKGEFVEWFGKGVGLEAF